MGKHQIRSVQAGEIIFKEGEMGDCAYLIEKGRVLIYLNKDLTEIPLRVVGEGDVFGEMSLIDANPRSASCRAESDGLLIMVTKEQLVDRLQAADPVVRLLMQVLLERLRSHNDRLRGKTSALDCLDPMAFEKKQAVARIGFENKLAEALDNDEFLPYYQPIYDLRTGQMRGCEALIRWHSSDDGILSPGLFMDIMEESSLILRAGKMMIEKSMADLASMSLEFKNIDNFFVSINVSGRQFADAQFVPDLESCRRFHGLSPRQIKLEITERIMAAGPMALEVLNDCRKLGYQLAVDDFGTGFSSLQYLAQMPLTDLKIDRSFVVNMTKDHRCLSVIKSLIYLAESLGLNLIAEGIETPQELALLNELNVGMGQGYFFSKALSFKDLIQMHSFVLADAA